MLFRSALGVVPADTRLAPKPEAIKDWDGLSADEKRLFARQMEVFAAFGEYADAEIGRLIATLKDLGQLDNTLIFYVIGDNGASAEGGMNGLFNEMTYYIMSKSRSRSSWPISTTSEDRLATTTMRPAGRWRVTPRSPGPSRSPAATAARATAWSSTGRKAFALKMKSARNGIT